MLGSAIFICLIFVAAKSSIVGAYVSAVVGARVVGEAGLAGNAVQLMGPSVPVGRFLSAYPCSFGGLCMALVPSRAVGMA